MTTGFVIESDEDLTSSSSEEEDKFVEPPRLQRLPLAPLIQVADQSSSPTESEVELPTEPDDNMADRVKTWKHHLVDKRGGRNMIPRLPDDLTTISLDQDNQRVIRVDCERTRGSQSEFRSEETRKIMEAILTFYCQSERVKYKQGMNEVLAPFVFLKLRCSNLISWNQVFEMYYAFIEIFLPNMFRDEEFKFLQKLCVLFRTALRYHVPALSGRLDAATVTPEMYVTPWFLTLFASKTNLAALFTLWDSLIVSGDRHSIVFLSVSLCAAHARVLRSASISSLPETITKISITFDAVIGCWKRSVKMRTHTPPYFIQQLESAAEFDKMDHLPAHIERQLGGPDTSLGDLVTFPMLLRPLDLLRRGEVWKFLILDCRPEWAHSAHMGCLPLTVPFDLEDLVAGVSVFPVNDALGLVAKIVGVDVTVDVPTWPLETHICLMGLSDALVDAVGLMFAALSKLSNVPRISIVKGGFQAVHAEIPQELVDHDPVCCPLCNRITVDQLAQRSVKRRPRAPSIGGDSSGSSPTSPGMIGGALQRFRSFVTSDDSVSGSGASFLRSGGSFLIGSVPPLPSTQWVFNPNPSKEYVSKCQLNQILGREPSNDIEANALMIISEDFVRCCAAPVDMTALTRRCVLKMYGYWPLGDLVKITSKNGAAGVLLLYFSVESDPDLVITLIHAESAKKMVSEVRKHFRLAKKPNSG
jgi:hypothetical protein